MSFPGAIYAYFIDPLLTLLFVIVFAYVIASWLVSFGVIDRRNPNARAILGFLAAIVEPMARPIRRLIPPLAGVLDLSVLLVMLIITFLQRYAIPQLLVAMGAL